MSVSRWGTRASFGAGPLRGSVGTRGASAALFAGPFWLATGSGGRRSASRSRRSGSTAGQRTTRSSRRANGAAAQYAAYSTTYKQQGVTRRNRVEIEAAACQTLILDWSSVVAWAQPFLPARVPLAPKLPTEDECRKATKAHLKATRSLPLVRRRRQTIDRATDEWLTRLQLEHRTVTARLREAAQGFKALEPGLNLIAFQAAFADNGVPAIGIDLQGGVLTLLLLFPSAADMVWPEKVDTTARGSSTVKKRTQAEVFAEHARLLVRYVFASAKEALCVQPALSSVRVIAIDEQDQGPLSRRRVFADVSIDRSDLVNHEINSTWVGAWQQVIEAWESTAEDADELTAARLSRFLQEWSQTLSAADAKLITRLSPRVAARQSKSGELVHLDVLGSLLPDVDSLPVDVEGDPEPIDPLGDSPLEFFDIDFWLEALVVSKQWQQALTAAPPAALTARPTAATGRGSRPTLGTHTPVVHQPAQPAPPPAARPRLNVAPLDPTS